MPFNEVYLPLIRMAFPEAKVVHVQRDPRDVAVSILANSLSHGFNCGYRIEDIVRHLAATAGLLEYYRHEFACPVFDLRYEEFVANQERDTRRLLDFLELKSRRCLRFHENSRMRRANYERSPGNVSDRSIGRHRPSLRKLDRSRGGSSGRAPSREALPRALGAPRRRKSGRCRKSRRPDDRRECQISSLSVDPVEVSLIGCNVATTRHPSNQVVRLSA